MDSKKVIEVSTAYLEATITEFPKYSICNNGFVFTEDYNHTRNKKQIKTFKTQRGYVACNLMQNGVRKRILVHRLVGEAFIPNPFFLPTINHKNGIKDDNNVANLEWLSVADNLKHSHRSGFVNYSKGENHYRSVLTAAQVHEVKSHLLLKAKGREIAKMFNVSEKYISAIKCQVSRIHES